MRSIDYESIDVHPDHLAAAARAVQARHINNRYRIEAAIKAYVNLAREGWDFDGQIFTAPSDLHPDRRIHASSSLCDCGVKSGACWHIYAHQILTEAYRIAFYAHSYKVEITGNE